MKKASIKYLSISLTITLISVFSPPTLTAKPLSPEAVQDSSRKIDSYIAEYLAEKQIEPNSIIDDATFLRRTYLSINGRIPTIDETQQFLSNPADNKRSQLIDQLIGSDGYKSHMFNFWANLLRLQTNQRQFGLGWHNWIRDAVDENMPYDNFVNNMLSAKGMASENPAVGYYLRDSNMLLDNVSNTAQVFLGTQIGCAQCHDDPYNDLTQKQYYEFASFIGDTTYKNDAARHMLNRITSQAMKSEKATPSNAKRAKKKAANNRQQRKKLNREYSKLFRYLNQNAITNNPSKKLRLPKDYQYNDGEPGDILTPKTIFGEDITHTVSSNHQQDFANWVTSPENPRFTKAIVNRLWSEVFGRGIVSPLDNWSETTRISHPELLDYLCEVMKSVDYDVQEFIRILHHTKLFESAAATEEAARSGAYDFKGPLLRRMSSEELHDSLIVLKFGDQDSQTNDSIEKDWVNYTSSIQEFFKLSNQEVIALNAEFNEAEKALYEKRTQTLKIKKSISQAEAEGNTKKVAQLKKDLRRHNAKDKKQRRENKNSMMSMLTKRNLRTSNNAKNLRASEQPSPANPSSFIRQFGSSDRATTNAAHTHSSIPQTLSLLNGNEIASLSDKQSCLIKGITKEATSSKKLDHLFLSIYNQLPSEAERSRYEPMMNNVSTMKPLITAMLNSKRFFFVQ